jgi:outer membrane protein TolC
MRHAWILALLAVMPAGAGETKTLPLSLARAVEIATAPDGATRVRLAREQIAQADARRRQTLGALLPNVDGSYTYRSFTNNLSAMGINLSSIPFVSIPLLVGPIETNDMRATASQSLFDLAAIRRYQASKAQSRAARADEDATLNQTKGAVAKAYLNALRAEAALDAAKANVALAERILRQARSQKEAGTGTGIEITRAEVSLANERQRQIVATEERNTARLRLLREMNVELDVELQLTDKLEAAPAELPTPAQAIEAARLLRPELKAQAERQRAAQLSYQSLKAERLPSASAFGDYGTLGKAGAEQLPTRSVGVSVKIPLWDGGRRDARRGESASQLRSETIRTQDTSRQVELDIRLAIEAQSSADSQARVTLEALQQSEKELAQAERRLEAGVASGLEVTDAQARLARARDSRVLALFSQRAARIDLGVAVGNVDMLF